MNKLAQLSAILSTKSADTAAYHTEHSSGRSVIEYDGLRMSGPDYEEVLNRFKEKFPGRQLWSGALRLI